MPFRIGLEYYQQLHPKWLAIVKQAFYPFLLKIKAGLPIGLNENALITPAYQYFI